MATSSIYSDYPVPHCIVSWNGLWVSPVPPELESMRCAAYRAIRDESLTLMDRGSRLAEYANAVVLFAYEGSAKKRRAPLVFGWAFRAPHQYSHVIKSLFPAVEVSHPSPLGRVPTLTCSALGVFLAPPRTLRGGRASGILVEVALGGVDCEKKCLTCASQAWCAAITAATLYYRATDADESAAEACCQCLRRVYEQRTWRQDSDALGKRVISDAQWARLVRDGLPLQLQHNYLCLFALHVRCHLVITSSRQARVHRSSRMRHAEDIAAEYMMACRRALCDSNLCTDFQVSCYQKLYDDAHETYQKLVCEQATSDAEQALESTVTHAYVGGLVRIAREAGEHLRNYAPTEELTRRWAAIAEVLEPSTTHVRDLYEVRRWRLESLPRYRASDPLDVDWALRHMALALTDRTD